MLTFASSSLLHYSLVSSASVEVDSGCLAWSVSVRGASSAESEWIDVNYQVEKEKTIGVILDQFKSNLVPRKEDAQTT